MQASIDCRADEYLQFQYGEPASEGRLGSPSLGGRNPATRPVATRDEPQTQKNSITFITPRITLAITTVKADPTKAKR